MLDWRLIDPETGRVNLDAWNERCMVKTSVGTCHCGAVLMPERANPVGSITWLSAECTAGHYLSLPASRLLRQPLAVAG